MASNQAPDYATMANTHWTGMCDSSWVRMGMDVVAAADYVRKECHVNPFNDMALRRHIYGKAVEDVCRSPKYSKGAHNTAYTEPTSDQAEATLLRNCQYQQAACDPTSNMYEGLAYNQLFDHAGNPTHNVFVQGSIANINQLPNYEVEASVASQKATSVGVEEALEASPPDNEALRQKLLAQERKALPNLAYQHLAWRDGACIQDPGEVKFYHWCVHPAHRSISSMKVDGTNPPPFQWNPYWCLGGAAPPDTALEAETPCGTWTSFCRQTEAYCHAFGREWSCGSGTSWGETPVREICHCKEGALQTVLGFILTPFLVNNVMRYGYMVYDHIQGWATSGINDIKAAVNKLTIDCSGKSVVCEGFNDAMRVYGGTVEVLIAVGAGVALGLVDGIGASADDIYSFFHTGNPMDLIDGLFVDWGKSMVNKVGSFLSSVFSDKRLKTRIRVAAPDFFGPGIHLHRYAWNARARRLYGLTGSAYGVLTSDLVQAGYGHLLATDKNGYEHILVARLLEETNLMHLSHGQAVDPVYMRLLALVGEDAQEVQDHLHAALSMQDASEKEIVLHVLRTHMGAPPAPVQLSEYNYGSEFDTSTPVRVYTPGPDGALPLCDPYAVFGKHIPCVSCTDKSYEHNDDGSFVGAVVTDAVDTAAPASFRKTVSGQVISISNKLEDYAKAPEDGAPSDATTPKPHPCINPRLQCAAPPSETSAFGEAVGGLPYHGMDALCKATGIDSGQCGSCMQSPSKTCKGADIAFAALGQMAMLASPALMFVIMLPQILSPGTGAWTQLATQMVVMHQMTAYFAKKGGGYLEKKGIQWGTKQIEKKPGMMQRMMDRALGKNTAKDAAEKGSANIADREAGDVAARQAGEVVAEAAGQGVAKEAAETAAETAAGKAAGKAAIQGAAEGAEMMTVCPPCGAAMMVVQMTVGILFAIFDPGNINAMMTQEQIDSIGTSFASSLGQPQAYQPASLMGSGAKAEIEKRAQSYMNDPRIVLLNQNYQLCRQEAMQNHLHGTVTASFQKLMDHVGIEWKEIHPTPPPAKNTLIQILLDRKTATPTPATGTPATGTPAPPTAAPAPPTAAPAPPTAAPAPPTAAPAPPTAAPAPPPPRPRPPPPRPRPRPRPPAPTRPQRCRRSVRQVPCARRRSAA